MTPPNKLRCDERWRQLAACVGLSLDIFYPTTPGATSYSVARTACASCPVIDECIAEMKGDEWGFWGGMSPRERASRTTSKPPARWSTAEDGLIASTLTDIEVAARTGRSVNAVRLRRSRADMNPHRPIRRRRARVGAGA